MKTRVFNVGAYRRKVGGSEDAEFFDAANKAAAAKREEMAWTVLNELLVWLKLIKRQWYRKTQVAFYKAENKTVAMSINRLHADIWRLDQRATSKLANYAERSAST